MNDKEFRKIIKQFDIPYVICGFTRVYSQKEIEKAKKKFFKFLKPLIRRFKKGL